MWGSYRSQIAIKLIERKAAVDNKRHVVIVLTDWKLWTTPGTDVHRDRKPGSGRAVKTGGLNWSLSQSRRGCRAHG
jgi:hypothetical protein